MIPVALLTAALPTVIDMAIKFGQKVLPANASQAIGKALDVVKSGIGPAETALQVIKHVAGVTQQGQDIPPDQLAAHLQSMNAAVDQFEGRANELRQQT